jgi:hypothetical protein
MMKHLIVNLSIAERKLPFINDGSLTVFRTLRPRPASYSQWTMPDARVERVERRARAAKS